MNVTHLALESAGLVVAILETQTGDILWIDELIPEWHHQAIHQMPRYDLSRQRHLLERPPRVKAATKR